MPAILPSYQNNYHLLRHLAAFMVIYAHCHMPGDGELLYRLSHGRIEASSLGVRIFFIISGYLVTKSLINSENRWIFLRKRFLRLWPALLTVTFLLAFVIGPFKTTLPIRAYFLNSETWRYFIRNIFFLPVFELPGVSVTLSLNSTFGTLFFEALCYILLALIGVKLAEKSKFYICTVTLLLIFNYCCWPFLGTPGFLKSFRYGINSMMPLFFMSSMWLLLQRQCARDYSKWWAPALVVCLAAFLLPLPRVIAILLQDISLVILLASIGNASPVFKWPVWDISYAVYLMGMCVQVLLMQASPFFQHTWPLMAATLLITVPLAFCSWHFIEKPFLLKK